MKRCYVKASLIHTAVVLSFLMLVLQQSGAGQTAQPKPTPEVQALLDQGLKARQAVRPLEEEKAYNLALERARALGDHKGEAEAIGKIGRFALRRGKREEARKLADQYLDLSRKNGDKSGEAGALLNIGEVAEAEGQRDRAKPLFEQALVLARQTKDPLMEAHCLSFLARWYFGAAEYSRAAALYEQAVPLYKAAGERRAAAIVLNNIGGLLQNQSRSEKALSTYREALKEFEAIGDKEMIATALTAMAGVYINTSRPAEALEPSKKALPIFRFAGNRSREADTLGVIGRAYADLSRTAESREWYLRSLDVSRAARSGFSEGLALQGLGECDISDGLTLAAHDRFQEGVAVARRIHDRLMEANILKSLGFAQQRLGRTREARDSFNRSVQLALEIGQPVIAANSLVEIASLDRSNGEMARASAGYERALKVLEGTGADGNVAYVQKRMAEFQMETGHPTRAIELLTSSAAMYNRMGSEAAKADTLLDMAMAYSALRVYPRAIDTAKQSIATLSSVHATAGISYAYKELGRIYASQGNHSAAVIWLSKGLAAARKTRNNRLEADSLKRLGHSLRELKRYDEALSRYHAAMVLYRASGVQEDQAAVLHGIAFIESVRGKSGASRGHMLEAIDSLERMRSGLGGYSESKSGYLGEYLYVYYDALRLLLKQHQDEKAFIIAQKTKARSLLDLLSSGRVELNSALSPDERSQEQELKQRANALNAQMVNEGVENKVGAKKRFAALQKQLKETEAKLQTFTEQLYARHPELARKRTASTARLQDVAHFLPSDTALLDYVVLSNKQIALFVVTSGPRGAKVIAVTLPIDYNRLAKKTSEFRSACADPRKDYRAASRELSALLISPARGQLKTAKRLLICPDGALWDVPFQALLLPSPKVGKFTRIGGVGGEGRFLSDRYEIVYAYSATGAQAALTEKSGRKKPEATLLALANPDFGSSKRFGDLDDLPGQRPFDTPSRPFDTPSRPFDTPSRPIDVASRTFDSVSRVFDAISRSGRIAALPGTQREADALKRDFRDAKVLTGAEAQEGTAKAEAGKYRYLHFATHGFFNDASPLLSSIVLAQPEAGSKEDGFLTAREIFDMDLSAEMVVLSACNTARGVQRSGDGVIGLTWALFVAGCPTQVVSQWAVDDASTATLMESFYANLTQKKMGKGRALRQASLDLMKYPKYHHPYYWAPFVLMGDWR